MSISVLFLFFCNSLLINGEKEQKEMCVNEKRALKNEKQIWTLPLPLNWIYSWQQRCTKQCTHLYLHLIHSPFLFFFFFSFAHLPNLESQQQRHQHQQLSTWKKVRAWAFFRASAQWTVQNIEGASASATVFRQFSPNDYTILCSEWIDACVSGN